MRWLKLDEPGQRVVDAGAICAALLNIAFCLIYAGGLEGTSFDFALFVLIATLLPFLSALILLALGRSSEANSRREVVTASFRGHAIAGTGILLLSAVPQFFFGEGDRWVTAGAIGLFGVVVVHGIWLASQLLTRSRTDTRRSALGGWAAALTSHGAVALAAGLAVLILLPANAGIWLLGIGAANSAALSPPAGSAITGVSLLYAGAIVAAVLLLIPFEARLRIGNPEYLDRLLKVSVALLVPAFVLFYADFALDTDVLHFMANVGPAQRIAVGNGTPLVDAVSQYGLGPMLATWAGIEVFGARFGVANIVAQAHSFALYAALLACLYRMTRHRLAAMLLGFAMVGLLLAGWWHGNANLNSVPSSMGLRYLPPALVVLCISLLPRGRAISWPLFVSLTLAVMWSFETLIGAIAIYGLFLVLVSIHQRSVGRFIRGTFAGVMAPLLTGFAVISAWTLIDAGVWPDFAAYFAFARLYNPASAFWALAASANFLGWVPVALVPATGLALAFAAAFAGAGPARDALKGSQPDYPSAETLIYCVTPMAGLAFVMSAYFVSRSVPFTLIIALPPVAVLSICALLSATGRSLQGSRSYTISILLPGAALLAALSFSFQAVQRDGGPYQSMFGLCLHEGVCTHFGLAGLISERTGARPMLDQSASRNYFDTSGLAAEAVDLIARFEPGRPEVALFLGIHPTTIWSVHTDTVLFLAGKTHRWPISFVLTDELNPLRGERIRSADVKLDEGEAVFLRADEDRLGELESSILAGIREVATLCPADLTGEHVHVYRVTYTGTCSTPREEP